jgi:hypothetical protein
MDLLGDPRVSEDKGERGEEQGGREKRFHYGPVRLSYNLYFSAYFFSRNSVFLSQQISEQYF